MKKYTQLFLVLLMMLGVYSAAKAVPCADGSQASITNVVYNPCGVCGGMVTFNWMICNGTPGNVYQFSVSYTGGGIFGNSFTYSPTNGCQSGTGSIFIGTFKNNVSVDMMNTNQAFCLVPLNAVLPVVLSSFEAIAEEGNTKLSWATSMEDKLFGFAVERSYDGRVFEQIGFLNAGTNKQSTQSYSFIDDEKNVLKEFVYYRLKSLNIDGEFVYSKVIRVSNKVIDSKDFFYPNPASTELNIELTENIPTTIDIYSLDGRRVQQIILNHSQRLSITSLTPVCILLST